MKKQHATLIEFDSMNSIKYWSNCCGDLHHHGEYDITEEELPEGLRHAYRTLWNEDWGALCYLMEYDGAHYIGLVHEYGKEYAEESNLTMDELYEVIKFKAGKIHQNELFSNTIVLLGKNTGVYECHELIALIPCDTEYSKFKKIAECYHELLIATEKDAKKMNTKISYLYRDESNYKVHNTAVVEGVISTEQIKRIISHCDGGDGSNAYFIPLLVGLPENRFGEWTDDDHVWFEICEESFELTDKTPTVKMTVNDLVARFDAFDAASVLLRESELVASAVARTTEDKGKEKKKSVQYSYAWKYGENDSQKYYDCYVYTGDYLCVCSNNGNPGVWFALLILKDKGCLCIMDKAFHDAEVKAGRVADDGPALKSRLLTSTDVVYMQKKLVHCYENNLTMVEP